jgi:quercetin dioxygenase-like cupin family protein
MKKNKNILVIAVAIISLTALIMPGSALAQLEGIKRTDLQKNDLSVKGREVVQVRVDIGPGVVAERHSHPGEEIVYIIEGLLEYKLDGKPAVILKAGDVLFIPSGTPHAVKNVGNVNGAELATYIVEKGKPLIAIPK